MLSQTSLYATVPAHAAGTVDVTVTNPDLGSATLVNAYTYIDAPPAISSLDPSSGPVGGTTQINIEGTGFVSGASVLFDGIVATDVYVLSQTSLYATVPAHAAGTVDVTVTNPDLGSATLVNAYTYIGNENDKMIIMPVLQLLLE